MQIAQAKNRIVEKIIRNDAGELFRAWFLVCERNGRFYGRLVKVEPLSKELRIKNYELQRREEKYFFPITVSESIRNTKCFILNTLLNPYFSTIETFFTSQMTRAPSII